jgi:hypothetical protein
VDEVPHKFKQEQDDYQPRPRHRALEVESEEEVVAYVPPPQPLEPPPQPPAEPCCACLSTKKEEAEVCSKCIGMLCEDCIQLPSQARKCVVCKPQLCNACRKALGVKQAELKLRSYPIRLKDVVTMHFLDCKCEHCSAQ